MAKVHGDVDKTSRDEIGPSLERSHLMARRSPGNEISLVLILIIR
jgi:hypothetical protein